MALLLRIAAVLVAVQTILAVDGKSDESCTSRPFFDFEATCQLSITPTQHRRTDKGPFVTCRHDQQHTSNGTKVCTERFDDKCGVRLHKAWCCEESDGTKWKFVHEQFGHEMKIMEGDKCIGCHYKIGGEFDENRTHYFPNKRQRLEGAMLAFRCRDLHRHIDSDKFSKIAYLRRYDSNDTLTVVHPVAMLTCKERFRGMCAKRLSRSWCCEESNGTKWNLSDPSMTIMEGDKCIGCHYKIGGELDENGTKAIHSIEGEFAADGTNGTEATLSIEDEFAVGGARGTNATSSIDDEFAANGTMTASTLFKETGSTESRTFNMDDEFAAGTMVPFTLFSETGSTETRKIAYVLPAKRTITDDAVGVREVASWGAPVTWERREDGFSV